MTFELWSIITLAVTIVIVPVYFWLMHRAKNTWITSSHDTQGGSMTITKNKLKITFKDPIVKKK